MIYDSIGDIPHLNLWSPTVADFKMPSSFNIKRTGSYTVTDHFARIKHGGAVKLHKLFLTFDPHEAARSFHCDYTIRPANLPDPVRGRLHFVIEYEDANNTIDRDEE
jgi:hypothetical protein